MIDTIDIKLLNMPESAYNKLLNELKSNRGKDGYRETLSKNKQNYYVGFMPNYRKDSSRRGTNPIFKISLLKRMVGNYSFYYLTVAIKLLSLFDREDAVTKTITFDKFESIEEKFNNELINFKRLYNIELPEFAYYTKIDRIDFALDVELERNEKKVYLDIIRKATPKHDRKKVKDSKSYTTKGDKLIKLDEQTNKPIKSIRCNYRTMNYSCYDKFYDACRKAHLLLAKDNFPLRLEIQLFKKFFYDNKFGKSLRHLTPQQIFSEPDLLFQCFNYVFNEFFDKYLKVGNYYSMRKATKLIRQSSYRKTTQDKLIETMQNISRYGMIKAPMMSLTKAETFNGYLKKLQELNINPIPIKKKFVDKYNIEYLPNLKIYMDELFIS